MKLKKYEGNPILKPKPDSDWESLCVLNPAVEYDNGEYKMLYRAAGNDDEHYIYIGLATSTDGFNFTRQYERPVLCPDQNGADSGGVEDPRIIKMGGGYYVTYAARPYFPGKYWLDSMETDEKKKLAVHDTSEEPLFMKENKTVTYLAWTKDCVNFKKLGRISDSRLDNRDVILFPEKVNGKYVQLSRPMEWAGEGYPCEVPSIWISYSDDLLEWDDFELLATTGEWWEDKKIGASTPPIKTDKGWLLLYHGVSRKDGGYRVGALLLDLDNPSMILGRTKDFIMEPEHSFETEGFYNGCVFPTGNVVVDGILYVYYGAADKYICVATCELEEILDELCCTSKTLSSHLAYLEKEKANDAVKDQFYAGKLDTGSLKVNYQLFVPAGVGSGEKYPLVIHLHGAGERGENSRMVLNNCSAVSFANPEFQAENPCFVFAPQCKNEMTWRDERNVGAVLFGINMLLQKYPIDQDRIYITGLSLGAIGIWNLISKHGEVFAAAMPVCGAGELKMLEQMSDIPIWAFHAADDDVVLESGSFEHDNAVMNGTGDLVDTLEKLGRQNVRYTKYKDGYMLEKHGREPHASWVAAYEDIEAKKWLFSKSKRADL